MKIALIAALRSNPLACEIYLDKALRDMGHEVVSVDFRIPEECSRARFSLDTDLVIGWKASYTPVTEPLYNVIQALSCPKVLWYPDIWEMEHTKADLRVLHRYYDVLYTCNSRDEFFLSNHYQWKSKKVIKALPPGVDTDVFKPTADPNPFLIYDVSFVGSLYSSRRQYLEFMHENNINIIVGDKMTHQEMIDVYQKSKLVFNQGLNNQGIQLRILETMACGRCLLTNSLPPDEQIFRDKTHLVYYKDKIDLVTAVAYYLTHPQEREWIGQQARKVVLAKHTWKHRLEEIFEDVGLKQRREVDASTV